MRAMASVDPPVANGATMVIGRFGQSCAFACCAKAITAATATKARSVFIDPRPLMLILLICSDPGGANDLRPFHHFRLEELHALVRRAADRLVAERAKALLDIGQRNNGRDHAMQRRDDFLRR